MIENIALALERIEITIERVRDRQRMERERERANLLRAISHDLKERKKANDPGKDTCGRR